VTSGPAGAFAAPVADDDVRFRTDRTVIVYTLAASDR
jgi:hypothetical protein